MKPQIFNKAIQPILKWYGGNNLNYIKKIFLFEGYSLWWSSNLVKKDIYINNDWFVDLINETSGLKLQKNLESLKKRTFLYIVYLFFYDLYRYLLIKIFLQTNEVNQSDIFFYSLELNLTNYNKYIIDRHLGTLPLKANIHNYRSSYLLSLSRKGNFLNPFTFFFKTKKISKNKSNIHIVDKYIKITDIFKIHFNILKIYIKFNLIRRKMTFKKLFKINNYNTENILLEELNQSFFGQFQDCLFRAYSMKNFAETLKGEIKIINTLENLAAMRAIYFYVKRVNSNVKFISIQHSEINMNKIDLINHKNEFQNYDKKYQSPSTDLYLLHGNKALNLAAEYMPANKLSVIGCVKYDNFAELINQEKEIKCDVKTRLGINNKFNILIAPSVGVDFYNIFNLIRYLDFKLYNKRNIKFILSPHPLIDTAIINDFFKKNNLHGEIKINNLFPTNKVILASDLTITGFSCVALESLIFKVPSIRIIPSNSIPLFDDEKEIKLVENVSELRKMIDHYSDNKNFDYNNTLVIKDYFNKIDGKSANRFWQKIVSLDTQYK